jgi:hypothetical protein
MSFSIICHRARTLTSRQLAECDKDRWDLVEGEVSVEAKCFKTNPNTRDLKGWTCVCIAVFHDARRVLKLLLEHGGDPNIRSSYNKNAWDLAKDELDAAEKVGVPHFLLFSSISFCFLLFSSVFFCFLLFSLFQLN